MPSDPTNTETGIEEKTDKKCRECMGTNKDTKLIAPYTKPTGYYCSHCQMLYVNPSDELFRRDMKQFWMKYPDTSVEDNTTF